MTYFFGFYGPKIRGGRLLPEFCPKFSKTLKFGLFWGGERDRAAPPRKKRDGARHRGRKRGGVRTAWNGPTGALHRNHPRCARHNHLGREEGRGRRESVSAHTGKRHAGNTTGATGPNPLNAQTACNGVPAG